MTRTQTQLALTFRESSLDTSKTGQNDERADVVGLTRPDFQAVQSSANFLPKFERRNRIPEIGERFGDRVVVSAEGKHPKAGCLLFKVRCKCGDERVLREDKIRSTKMCRRCCRLPEFAAAVHRIWSGIINRCENPKCENWHRYGGRGITVCDRWRTSPVAFAIDMGPRPSRRHSIDRIDVNGNYEPGNCRWATHKQQVLNTGNRKLNPELASEIRARAAKGEPQRSIARAYAVDQSMVSQIVRGVAWNEMEWSKP